MNITFRQLKIFEAVAHHLSFTRASEALRLTQPAVSMQIKQLESAVGLPLFEQLGKKVFLTDAGQEFSRYASAITGQLDELDVVKFPIMRYWFIVFREGKRLSMVAQSFREFVLKESARILGAPSV